MLRFKLLGGFSWLGPSRADRLSAAVIAGDILDQVNKLRNSKLTDAVAVEIVKPIWNLVNLCNVQFLKDIQVGVIYIPDNAVQTEIKSWYFSDLNPTNLRESIFNTFEELERNLHNAHIETSNRCIDAICVLVDYINAVVLYRTIGF